MNPISLSAYASMEIVRTMRKSRIQQQCLIAVVVICCLFLLKEEPCGVTSLLCSLPQCTAESSSDHLWTVQHSCNRRASSGSKIACTSQISAIITSYLSPPLSCHPQKDQVVSIFVKNTSDRRLTINEETSFMGYFVSA